MKSIPLAWCYMSLINITKLIWTQFSKTLMWDVYFSKMSLVPGLNPLAKHCINQRHLKSSFRTGTLTRSHKYKYLFHYNIQVVSLVQLHDMFVLRGWKELSDSSKWGSFNTLWHLLCIHIKWNVSSQANSVRSVWQDGFTKINRAHLALAGL